MDNCHSGRFAPPAFARGPLHVLATLVIAAAGVFATVHPGFSQETASQPRLPNIVFVLADDLGYGDLSCFGQQRFQTPNIDRIAKQGMRFTRHYSGSPVCAPSRCVLMTGLHSGHSAVRNNRELKPEGQFPLPTDTLTLPRRLQEIGYTTGAFGKWGLGGPGSTGDPMKQGLDRFFGYNCQRVAHNYFPPHLWDDDQRLLLRNRQFAAHQRLSEGIDPDDPASYEAYTDQDYAPDLIAAQAVKFVEQNKDRPFFLYFPSIIPHLALQVPDEALGKFEGQFEDEPYVGGNGYLPHRTPRAAYAAMITRLDEHVGQLFAKVDELGLTENTIFVFTSDNGPLYNRLGGTDTDFFRSAGELRGRKGSVYEGGIRVPMAISWKGRIAAGKESDRVTGFEDWFATLCDLIGKADRGPQTTDGISFAPTLLGAKQPPREFLYREFPAYGGQQSLLVGDWKAVRQKLMPQGGAKGKAQKKGQAGGGNKSPDLRIELYNLKTDPNETTDVASQHPQIVARMERMMREQHRPSKDFPFPALDQLQ